MEPLVNSAGGQLTLNVRSCQDTPVLRTLLTLSTAVLLAGPNATWAQEAPKPPKKKEAQTSIETLIAEGRRELNRNAAGKAEAIFRKAIEAAPKNALAHNELGVALFQQGAFSAAIKPLETAVKLNPRLPNAWANLGEARRRAKQHKKAAVAFHKFLQLRKGEPYALFGLGASFEGYGSLSKGIRTMRIALKRSVAEEQDLLTERIRKAIARIERKILDSRRPAVERGDELVRAGRYKEAIAVYEKALGKKRTDGELLGRIGLVRGILGEKLAATETLREALLYAPKDPVARAAYALITRDAARKDGPEAATGAQGDALLSADRAAMAYQEYTRLLTADPNNKSARTNRGEAGLRLGRLDEAAVDFELGGDDIIAVSGIAEIQWIQGQHSEAKKTLKAVGKTVPLGQLAAWRRSLLNP